MTFATSSSEKIKIFDDRPKDTIVDGFVQILTSSVSRNINDEELIRLVNRLCSGNCLQGIRLPRTLPIINNVQATIVPLAHSHVVSTLALEGD
jgi:hypothetical protein